MRRVLDHVLEICVAKFFVFAWLGIAHVIGGYVLSLMAIPVTGLASLLVAPFVAAASVAIVDWRIARRWLDANRTAGKTLTVGGAVAGNLLVFAVLAGAALLLFFAVVRSLGPQRHGHFGLGILCLNVLGAGIAGFQAIIAACTRHELRSRR